MTGVLARALLGLGLAAGLLGAPRAAAAHGALKASQPKAGAHLGEAPRELRLTFTERAELAVTRIELLGPGDSAVALSPLRYGDTKTVVVTDIMGALIAGTYTVAWQVVGRDGHPVRGRFRFTIAPGAAGLGVAAASEPVDHRAHMADSAGPAAAPAADTLHHDPTALPIGAGFDAESPLFAAVRWLGYVGMLALVGTIIFARVVLPDARRRWTGGPMVDDGALRRIGAAAALLLLAATLLRLAAQSVAMHDGAEAASPSMIGAMLGSTLWGRAWMLQLGASLVALAGFAMIRRGNAVWMLVATGIFGSALAMSLSGHAAAVPVGRTNTAIGLDALHVLAAGGWLGTLLVLVAVGLPSAMRASPADRGPAAAALVNAFSPHALTFASIVVFTGVAGALIHLESPSALWTTEYGQVLFRKLVILSLVIAIGAWNWRRVRPSLGDEAGAARIRRSSIAELAVGALVLAVTAILVATPI